MFRKSDASGESCKRNEACKLLPKLFLLNRPVKTAHTFICIKNKISAKATSFLTKALTTGIQSRQVVAAAAAAAYSHFVPFI